jgi:hypothetical protein
MTGQVLARYLGRILMGSSVLVALLTGLGCGTAQGGPAAELQALGDVYRLHVRAVEGPGARTEWIDLNSGQWRIEQGEETIIFTGDSYVTVSEADGVNVRTGSNAYLGPLADRIISRRPLQSYFAGHAKEDGVTIATSADGKPQLRFRTGESSVRATIEAGLSRDQAERMALFVIPPNVRTTAREVPIGAPPTIPVRAYWFGPALEGRSAVIATEHYTPLTKELLSSPGWTRRDEAVIHSTFYELAPAGGKSSALPDQDSPDGEIRVVSQPLSAQVAQVAIEAYNGRNGDLEYDPWPREKVVLADGEEAIVIADRADGSGPTFPGFAVITETTLVNVIAPVRSKDMAALARLLRPL